MGYGWVWVWGGKLGVKKGGWKRWRGEKEWKYGEDGGRGFEKDCFWEF